MISERLEETVPTICLFMLRCNTVELRCRSFYSIKKSNFMRQRQRERAALAEIALEEQRAADQVGQVLAQVQAQARAFGMPGRGGVQLREGLEQLGLVFLADAGAAVGHGEFDDVAAFALALCQRYPHLAGLGELDGV